MIIFLLKLFIIFYKIISVLSYLNFNILLHTNLKYMDLFYYNQKILYQYFGKLYNQDLNIAHYILLSHPHFQFIILFLHLHFKLVDF